MKESEKIYEAVANTDEKMIEEAEKRYAALKAKKRGKGRLLRIILPAAALAVIAAVVFGAAASRKAPLITDVVSDTVSSPQEPAAEISDNVTTAADESSQAAYSEPEPDQTSPQDTADVSGHQTEDAEEPPVTIEIDERKPFSYLVGLPELTGDYLKDYKNRTGFHVNGLDAVYDKLTKAMTDAGMEVVSPVNVYAALSMLAECTDGATRMQILDLLGAPDMETLRDQSKNVWRSLYREDDYGSTVSANSVWLDSAMKVYENCVEKLVSDHYASVSAGDFKSGEYRAQIKKWLSDNTRGILDGQINSLKIPEDSKAVLASTLYMKATWERKFNKNKVNGVFNGKKACGFMTSTPEDNVYFEDGFTAYCLKLGGNAGCVWLFLPDEGKSVKNLFAAGLSSYINGKKSKPEFCLINLRVPEFDVCADVDISDALRSLGVTGCFGKDADFSPLTDDPLYVSEIRHAARLTADTDGIEGAAYTVMIAPGAADPGRIKKIDLFFDRTFAFAVVDGSGTPVFAGIIDEDSVK